MIHSTILTRRAQEVIAKRLRNEKLTQQDSNYLSRFVRPKLRAIASMDASTLLRKLEYHPKARAIERKVKKIVLNTVADVAAIILCGSAIQTNYNEYNDIDVIIATKNELHKELKKEVTEKIEEGGKKEGLTLDVQVYPKAAIVSQYPSNPSLIYQLKDSKCIYGKLKVPRKIALSPLDLKMKLDWSEGLSKRAKADEIYLALRNALLVLLLIRKKIDNEQLRENLKNILGQEVIERLKNNAASHNEKMLALNCLHALVNHLETELNKPPWEKLEIENRSYD